MVTGHAGVGAKISGQAAQTARLMLYSLLAVVLMAMDHRGQYVPRLRGMANYLVEPVYQVIDWPVQALRGVFSFFQNTRALLRENERLQERLLARQGELQQLDALREENRRLRQLLDGAAAVRHEFQFAELIAVDLDPFAHKVVIDRGAARGVTPGQAVIDGRGVMGQVEDVQRHIATVRLISDPNHALPVQINRTGLRAVAFGTGDTARLRLPSLPREADVREGDLLVTSGLGDRFPGGYPVARIERIDRREGQMFAAVEARPLAALDRGREVLLIKTFMAEPAAGEGHEPEGDADTGVGDVDLPEAGPSDAVNATSATEPLEAAPAGREPPADSPESPAGAEPVIESPEPSTAGAAASGEEEGA